jgi:hypothetical protein
MRGKVEQLLLDVDMILEAVRTTGYRMDKRKSSLWNLRMNLPLLALLDRHLSVDACGMPVPGIVLLGSNTGSADFVADDLRAKTT